MAHYPLRGNILDTILGDFMAFINSTSEELAIIQIQRILRELELLEGDYSAVPLSGVYENETRESVAEFQARYGLEATGIVDYETWELLHRVRDRLKGELGEIRRVQLIPSKREFLIYPGQRNDILYVIQYMLSQISTQDSSLEAVSYTGVYDKETEDAIRAFQRKRLIDANGIIDAQTLEALFDEYEAIIMRPER